MMPGDVILGYHGVDKNGIVGEIKTPFFLAYDKELGAAYAEREKVLTFEVTPSKPLSLETAELFWSAWLNSGAESVQGRFHPDQTHAFANWAKSQGYDAILIPESAFDGERGYELVAGRVGEPQMIVLDSSILSLQAQRLYHATYKPLLSSIMQEGLGGESAEPNWEDSKKGVVYMARDKEVAISYAETSDMVPEHFLEQIVVLEIDTSVIDSSKVHSDANVLDDDATVEYHGVIPREAIVDVIPQYSLSTNSPGIRM